MSYKKTQNLLILILGTIAVLSIIGCSSSSPTGKSVSVGDNEDFIKIPLSDLSSSMKRYHFDTNGVGVNYFAVIGSNGQVRTAFDACDVCGGSMGYRQNGNDVVCNKCGLSFDIDSIGTKNKGGGCWPSYLTHRIEGNYVLISKDEIAAGSARFR
ncbi:DUF2318 domain-containing protein [Candidatus Woesearchaeota archaeon]|nr:DUF2318 domain-containing protein [Candidatus Woesearchaeota archaeon]